MDDLKGTHSYDTILGRDKFSELNKDLCFSDNDIRGYVVSYK